MYNLCCGVNQRSCAPYAASDAPSWQSLWREAEGLTPRPLRRATSVMACRLLTRPPLLLTRPPLLLRRRLATQVDVAVPLFLLYVREAA